MCSDPFDPFLSKNWLRFDEGMKLFCLTSLEWLRCSPWLFVALLLEALTSWVSFRVWLVV